MAQPLSDEPTPVTRTEPTSIGELVDVVKTYAKQETLDPLKGAGRWIGFGAAGALALGLGLSLLLLGVLRLVQTEWDWTTSAGHSWLPYVIVLVATLAVLAVVVSRIPKSFLNKEDQR